MIGQWVPAGSTSGRMVKQGYAFIRAFQAIVRWDRITERCPHSHRSPSAARKCGEAAAKRMNRRGYVPEATK